MPEEDRAVILEQWQWLQEPVKLPGSYMQERELSNAWNKIVFDGVNPRPPSTNAIIIINREITRKMEEFGYLADGVQVKEFRIPTIDTVKNWMGTNAQLTTTAKPQSQISRIGWTEKAAPTPSCPMYALMFIIFIVVPVVVAILPSFTLLTRSNLPSSSV